MLFETIFVSIFVVAWLLCGFLPWLVLSVATKGEAGLASLPLCLFAAVVSGIAVPVMGANGGSGIWMSMVAAVAVPSLLLALRRLSLQGTTTATNATKEHQTK